LETLLVSTVLDGQSTLCVTRSRVGVALIDDQNAPRMGGDACLRANGFNRHP